MKQIVVTSVIILILSASACDKDLMNRKKTTYDVINIKGLLDTLAQHTARSNPLIIKQSEINKDKDTVEIKLDSGEWRKELQVFDELNIRSSRLIGRYTREERTLQNNNLLTIWRANDFKGEDLDSIMLLQHRDSSILNMKFYINQKNNLFESMKFFSLSFDDSSEALKLSSYYIKGVQKMVMNDSNTFEMSARLQY